MNGERWKVNDERWKMKGERWTLSNERWKLADATGRKMERNRTSVESRWMFLNIGKPKEREWRADVKGARSCLLSLTFSFTLYCWVMLWRKKYTNSSSRHSFINT